MKRPIVLDNHLVKSYHSDPSYKFYGARNICKWPMSNGFGLGTCGMWNFLWRLGYHPTLCRPYELASDVDDNVLFAHADHPLDEPIISHLRCWLKKGKTIVASGTLSAWHPFLKKDLKWKEIHLEHPLSALAYLIPNHEPQLMAPPQWIFAAFMNKDGYSDLTTSGSLAEIHGERQTPSRALITKIEYSPAVINQGSFFYLNGNPFAAFQSWLQGQENLNPWMAWRHRLFWLDEWVSFMATVLFDINALSRDIPRPGIKGLSDTTIVLKHDLDYSTDTSYLSEETKQDLRGTYAVLKDAHTSFWVDTLRKSSHHESAFHYNTYTRNWFKEVKRLILKKRPAAIVPSSRQISGKGLLRQVRWAKQKGIGINTLHRHGVFLLYPEWIDALNEVLESESEVLGGNSLFGAHILRWGIDTIDGDYGYLGEWSDSQFPLWYPFRISHAAMGGKILNGWESTSMMEIEPSLLSQMLDYKIKELPQRVFTFNFHPAHAHIATFRKHGSFDSFKRVLDIINELKITVKPLNEVYRLASDSASL